MAYSKEIKDDFAKAKTFEDFVSVNRWNETNIAFEKAFHLIETREQALTLARTTYDSDHRHGCHHAGCQSTCDVRTIRALRRYYELPADEDFHPSDEDVAYIEMFVWSDESLFRAKAQAYGFL